MNSWPVYAYEHGLITKNMHDAIVKAFAPASELMTHTDNLDDLLVGSDIAWDVLEYELLGADTELKNGPNPGYNPLNIAVPCIGGTYTSTTVWCYDFTNIGDFITRPQVLEALNITKTNNWTFSNATGVSTQGSKDFFANSIPRYSTLLNTGVPGIVSCGLNDLNWNCIGIENVINETSWTGQKKFNTTDYKTWSNYGEYKHLNNFTFMKVNNSGFFTPMDTPATSLLILDRLLKNKGW